MLNCWKLDVFLQPSPYSESNIPYEFKDHLPHPFAEYSFPALEKVFFRSCRCEKSFIPLKFSHVRDVSFEGIFPALPHFSHLKNLTSFSLSNISRMLSYSPFDEMLAQSRDSRKLTATALHLTSKQILTVGGSCQLRHLRMAANYKSADIPYIPTLRSFSLWNAPNFSDCHNLRHLFFVELVLCDQITSLEGMKVAVLKVSRCSLQSLEGLRGDKYHRSITIKQCSDIKDFSPLSNVERVTIGDCLGFTDCSQIKGVKDFTIILCENLLTLASLYCVESLTLVKMADQFISCERCV